MIFHRESWDADFHLRTTCGIAWEADSANPKFRIHDSRLAFTLTELLVSMTILSGLIVLLFSVVDGTTKTWNQSEQRVDSFREARAALFIIARDLQTMVPAPDAINEVLAPADPNYAKANGIADFKYFFVNSPTTGTSDVTFSGVAQDTYGDRLFFMSAQPSGAQTAGAKSDVCLIGYYQDYTNALLQGGQSEMSGTQKVFKLYRYFKDSDATFTNLKAYTSNPPTSSSLMQSNSSTDEVLARNVVDFRVVVYDKDMKKIDTSSTAPDYGRVTPYAVDLSITAYNYSVASRLTDEAAWKSNPTITSAKQTFNTRVYLPRSGPLPTPTPTPIP